MERCLDILIVDDEPNIRRTLTVHFEGDGHRVRAVGGLDEARRLLGEIAVDLAFVDLRLGGDSGLDLIPELMARNPAPAVVVITAYASLETAIEAMKRGARDYLPKPFEPGELDLVIERLGFVDRLERRFEALEGDLARREPEPRLDSESPEMRETIRTARKVAASDTPVLLRGPSGTGKDVLAREIHRISHRCDGPFVVVPCPALPSELLESELFGHVKGAFTGAGRDRTGRVAVAEGGTLLLDEIGDLPLELQPKLLRFVQERKYERVGDPTTLEADVRLIASTNHDLEAAVADGSFREDLFYRLNVVSLEVPPLARRPGDVIPLARHFLDFFARRHERPELEIGADAAEALQDHGWPGNVRELGNSVERAVMLGEGRVLEPADFGLAPAGGSTPVRVGGRCTLAELEREHIRRVVASAESYRKAAEVLGIDETTLWRRRKRYGMEEG